MFRLSAPASYPQPQGFPSLMDSEDDDLSSHFVSVQHVQVGRVFSYTRLNEYLTNGLNQGPLSNPLMQSLG